MPIVYKPGLKNADIDRMEQEIQKAFPLDYRAFLCRMNGFYLTAPDFVQLPLVAVDEGEVSFDRMFGFIPGEECNDVVEFNREFIGELDFLDGAIAIGEDGGGNPYVIVGGSNKSGVYYWDRTHLHEADSVNNFDIPEQNDCGNLFFVTSSFGEFYDLIIKCLGGSPDVLEEI